MFFDLSIGKILVLAVIALVVFGPDQLPKMAHQLGHTLRELRRRIEAQHAARPVPSRPNLADQRQSLRVWMQRCPDEFVRDVGAIVLGRIDVIDAEFGCAPQNRDRLFAVSRRPEHLRTRELHGAEADA